MGHEHGLTDAEREQYEHQGFIIRTDVFDPGEVATIADDCERLVDDIVSHHEQQRQQFGSYVFDADRVAGAS